MLAILLRNVTKNEQINQMKKYTQKLQRQTHFILGYVSNRI